MNKDKLLNADEVAQYLRVSTVFTCRLLRQGKIRGKKVGKEWRVKQSDLLEYLNQDNVYQSQEVSRHAEVERYQAEGSAQKAGDNQSINRQYVS